MSEAHRSPDGRSITVHVPMTFVKRGGRKLVVSPDGVTAGMAPKPQVDNTMIKALARAFRWRRLLEAGLIANLEEIAATEKINPSYVSRVLRLSLLAPDIVEAILDGRQTKDMTLAALMKPFPVIWADQSWVGLLRVQSDRSVNHEGIARL